MFDNDFSLTAHYDHGVGKKAPAIRASMFGFGFVFSRSVRFKFFNVLTVVHMMASK